MNELNGLNGDNVTVVTTGALPTNQENVFSWLPVELLDDIFSRVDVQDLENLSLVNWDFSRIITPGYIAEKDLKKNAIGSEVWKKYIGEVEEEQPIPEGVKEVWLAPCPFFPGKKIHETHILIWIPKTVNHDLLTINKIGELVENPKSGRATGYSVIGRGGIRSEIRNRNVDASHWALITKDVIPDSGSWRHGSWIKLGGDKDIEELPLAWDCYKVPEALDLITGIFMHYVCSGERLYPGVFSYCQEKVGYRPLLVGDFSSRGLKVDDASTSADLGVGACWKSCGPISLFVEEFYLRPEKVF